MRYRDDLRMRIQNRDWASLAIMGVVALIALKFAAIIFVIAKALVSGILSVIFAAFGIVLGGIAHLLGTLIVFAGILYILMMVKKKRLG